MISPYQTLTAVLRAMGPLVDARGATADYADFDPHIRSGFIRLLAFELNGELMIAGVHPGIWHRRNSEGRLIASSYNWLGYTKNKPETYIPRIRPTTGRETMFPSLFGGSRTVLRLAGNGFMLPARDGLFAEYTRERINRTGMLENFASRTADPRSSIEYQYDERIVAPMAIHLVDGLREYAKSQQERRAVVGTLIKPPA